jgi:hypothetical protein
MQTLKGEFVFSAGSYGEVLKGGAMDINEFGIFLFFGITIGFIYASVKVGDMMGIAGAGTTLKMIDGARKGIQGAVAGAAYRGTVGAGLNRVVKGIDSLDQKAEAGSKGARFARTIIGGESTRKAVEKASNYGAGGTRNEAHELRDQMLSRKFLTRLKAVLQEQRSGLLQMLQTRNFLRCSRMMAGRSLSRKMLGSFLPASLKLSLRVRT